MDTEAKPVRRGSREANNLYSGRAYLSGGLLFDGGPPRPVPIVRRGGRATDEVPGEDKTACWASVEWPRIDRKALDGSESVRGRCRG